MYITRCVSVREEGGQLTLTPVDEDLFQLIVWASDAILDQRLIHTPDCLPARGDTLPECWGPWQHPRAISEAASSLE